MPRGSSLLPREHGAYAQLAFPLATGLVVSHADAISCLFGLSASSWFLLHEPVAVLTGHRGRRSLDAFARGARRRGILLGVVGILSGIAAFVLAPPAGRMAALVPLGLASMMLPVVVHGGQKTPGGELLAIAAFAALVLPMDVSGGGSWQDAWVAGVTWFASFGLGTMVVHAIKVRHKRLERGRWVLWATPVLGLGVGGGAVVLALSGPWGITRGLAVLPAVVAVLIVHALKVHPRRLTRVGWMLVGANMVTLAMLVS